MTEKKARWRDRKGFVSLFVLLLLASMLPLWLFSLVELQYWYMMKDRAQQIADRMAEAAVQELDEEAWRRHEVKIDETAAKEVADRLFEEYVNKMAGGISEAPSYTVTVNNHVPTDVSVDGQTTSLSHPFVMVRVSLAPKGIFFHRGVVVHALAVEQAVSVGDFSQPIEQAVQFQKWWPATDESQREP
ncbi:hypothetical protein [Geobacillus subterraneus]|uniref:Uncharacterized protein n=1 Tax=Geobacillus subterraneus TaxID=129338 RepID=A0A679FQV5_9BACL|nr:hypothetical protein [Geobacillus subterraneus]BBW98948.1 hypothetical protein GsuE55_37810 [Geobacillus subterraneus]